ncbi:MAG: hypothetical protein IKG47_04100 [Oscillospiraceae bacterium]|nr:hypothetical protein [Oscillospiraceae bacterium]
MSSSRTVSEHFVCSPDIVWRVLTDVSSYQEWFGWPENLTLLEVVPGFSLGGKLNFRNSASTLVITKIEEGQRIAFTSAYQTDEISLRGAENGCKVTYTTTYQDVANTSEEEYPTEVRNRNILKNLRKTCYAYKNEEDKQKEHNHLNLRGMLFRMTRGYQQPRKNNVVEDPYTERNLYITTRNKIIGVLLTLILVSVITVGLSFERGDIVPSTGLSIAESDLVSFENAVQISVGQRKRDVEYMLSCAGKKESVDEFSYSSTEKDNNGQSVSEIRVVYDAYGRVRRYGFIDHTKAGSYGVPIQNFRSLVSPSMSVDEVKEELDLEPSAFWVDKSGTKYIYFGHYLFENDVFDANKTAELVLRLNEEQIQTQVGYYFAESPDDPLRVKELPPATKHQYSNIVQYDTDRAAYRRVYLLPGKTKEETDILLGMAEDVIELQLEDSEKQYTYLCGKTQEGYRYSYSVVFREGVVVSAFMRNHHLGQVRDTLASDIGMYSLSKGNTLFNVSSELQILPTSAMITEDGSVILGYGLESVADTDSDLPYRYPLIVYFDSNHRVTDITIN